MLIQSTFKDYYDSAASIGIDKTIIFKRTTSEVQLDDGFFIDGLPRYFPDDLPDEYFPISQSHPDRKYCKWLIIGFCGTYHVGVFNTLADGEHKHTMAYYGEEILTLDWKKEKGFWRYPEPKITIQNVLNQWHLKQDSKFFFELNTPIFTKHILHALSKYERKNKELYLEYFTTNPILSNYQFYKVVDVFTAFQNIQSFISGVLGTKENDTIEVSNESRIVKAGFDLKTSFRKDKRYGK